VKELPLYRRANDVCRWKGRAPRRTSAGMKIRWETLRPSCSRGKAQLETPDRPSFFGERRGVHGQLEIEKMKEGFLCGRKKSWTVRKSEERKSAGRGKGIPRRPRTERGHIVFAEKTSLPTTDATESAPGALKISQRDTT